MKDVIKIFAVCILLVILLTVIDTQGVVQSWNNFQNAWTAQQNSAEIQREKPNSGLVFSTVVFTPVFETVVVTATPKPIIENKVEAQATRERPRHRFTPTPSPVPVNTPEGQLPSAP